MKHPSPLPWGSLFVYTSLPCWDAWIPLCHPTQPLSRKQTVTVKQLGLEFCIMTLPWLVELGSFKWPFRWNLWITTNHSARGRKELWSLPTFLSWIHSLLSGLVSALNNRFPSAQLSLGELLLHHHCLGQAVLDYPISLTLYSSSCFFVFFWPHWVSFFCHPHLSPNHM